MDDQSPLIESHISIGCLSVISVFKDTRKNPNEEIVLNFLNKSHSMWQLYQASRLENGLGSEDDLPDICMAALKKGIREHLKPEFKCVTMKRNSYVLFQRHLTHAGSKGSGEGYSGKLFFDISVQGSSPVDPDTVKPYPRQFKELLVEIANDELRRTTNPLNPCLEQYAHLDDTSLFFY
jgi:hypothetical protein